MSLRDRIVILSDTHLGRPGSGARSASALRPLWQGASRLIVNGDVAELSDSTHRVEAARQVMQVQAFCEQDGVELTLLPGNHDPMVGDKRYLRLFGGEVFVTHGDALHPAISPWTGHRAQLRQFHDYAEHAVERHGGRLDDLDTALSVSQYASHFTWEEWYWGRHTHVPRWRRRLELPLKVARVAWYWQTLPLAAARFARRYAPECRYFVFGHIHRAGVWSPRAAQGRTLINTGSYDFPSKPHVVMIEGGELSVWRLRYADNRYVRAATPVRTFRLNNAADTPAMAA